MGIPQVPETVERLWNGWELRMVMLLSLYLQIFLILFGRRRKYTAGFWIGKLVWLAYLSADWVATFSLGILAQKIGDSETNRFNSNRGSIPRILGTSPPCAPRWPGHYHCIFYGRQRIVVKTSVGASKPGCCGFFMPLQGHGGVRIHCYL
ncbi:hypothetical protein OIU85_015670 [Salix viminalis]|uniref:DUF4220 domain-containing protein n=1 Tax=Salix viminalis TaxID=40686 RepID=A0A9Q0ZNW5_SALVM|nr:hypothetical protein OIU85_015670 [Salix viminalis]